MTCERDCERTCLPLLRDKARPTRRAVPWPRAHTLHRASLLLACLHTCCTPFTRASTGPALPIDTRRRPACPALAPPGARRLAPTPRYLTGKSVLLYPKPCDVFPEDLISGGGAYCSVDDIDAL